MAFAWFSYTGTIPSIPSSYTHVFNKPLCLGSTSLCAIYALAQADEGGLKPAITNTLITAIEDAVNGMPNAEAIDKDP